MHVNRVKKKVWSAALKYLKDFKSSNIQNSNERRSLSFGPVQSFVNAVNKPAEEALVGGFCQSFHCKVCLEMQTGTFIYPGEVIKRTRTQTLSQNPKEHKKFNGVNTTEEWKQGVKPNRVLLMSWKMCF